MKIKLSLFSLLWGIICFAQPPAGDYNWDLTPANMLLNDDFNSLSLGANANFTWQNGRGWDDKTYADTFLSISNITYVGTTVTVTIVLPPNTTSHGLAVNDKVSFNNVNGITPNLNNTLFTITATTNTTFNFSVSSISGVAQLNNAYVLKDYYFYQNSSNVYLDGNSHLILKSTYDESYPGGKPIHSGAITTNKTYGYGYYEINCKLNSQGKRYMPAFWIWGGADNCGVSTHWYNENDFFEAFQESASSTDFNLTSNVHYHVGANQCWGIDNFENGGVEYFEDNRKTGIDLYSSYHTYGYEWTPAKIVCYFDGVPYRYLNINRIIDNELLLTIDLGIKEGPGWNGKAGTDYLGINKTAEMTINHVKIYPLKRNCSPQTITGFNSGSYPTSDYSVRQSITINGTSNVLTGHKVTFRAEQGIQISGDFTAPLNSELTLLPTNCY